MGLDREQRYAENDQSILEIKDGFLVKIFKYFSRDSVGVKIIFVIGIMSILLGSWKMIYGIKNSFVSSQISLSDKSYIIEGLNSLKDTDGDGLSDTDEMNIYGTSPYLADTNSNDISDYDEVILGKGNNCTDILSCNASANLSVISASSSIFGEAINYDDIKKQLLEAGYSQEIIDQITPSGSEIENTNTASSELEKLKNLSIQEIKQLLISQGATESDLSKFSDEEIQSVYIQTLNEEASKNQ